MPTLYLNELQQQEARTPRAIRVKEERKNLMRVLGVNIDGSGFLMHKLVLVQRWQ